ncbi:MAG: FliH/SctL family protein [Aeoliella sp.]
MATIIKREFRNEQPTGRSVRPVAFNFEEMAGRADEYLASVRKEAAKIVQQAHSDAEQVRRNAEAAGREAAEQAIERLLDEKIAQQMKTLKPALESVAQQLSDSRGQWLEEWEVAAVHLAARMAERILRRELEKDPQVPLQLVRESLELAAGAAEITLRMNAHDLKHLREETDSIAASLELLAPAKIVADESVTPGGCRVTTEFGEIDQRIESQLARLEQELTG